METAPFNNNEVALFEEQLQPSVVSTDKPFIRPIRSKAHWKKSNPDMLFLYLQGITSL
jgi:hypothetical protein